MKRPAEEIKARCKSILTNERIVYLVKESSSPTAAYDMIIGENFSEKEAQAGRWLAILRRDYLLEYQQLVK